MNKKKSKKINVAFLGSSLPMLIFAYIYKKKYHCNISILDDSKLIGGAWQQFKYKNLYLRKQSNVILPLSKKSEKNQNNINFFLKKYLHVKIKLINKFVDVRYFCKRKYDYNFNLFYNKIKKLNVIKQIKVKKIKVLENKKILVNNKIIYDRVFIPTFFGIDKIYYLKKIINIDYKIITSHHIIALFEKTNYQKLFYSDFFNNFFDRVQLIKHKNFYSFSARITKKFKGSNNELIKKQLQKISNNAKIIKFFKFKYKNYYRNVNQITKLEKLEVIENITYIDTTNFIKFFEEMFFYFKYKSNKSKLNFLK